MAHLLDTRHVDSERVTFVCDKLHTHTTGAFYGAFEPEQVRNYVSRLEFCSIPKPNSWLNVAACELSCMVSQCLSGRRIGEVAFLCTEIRI